MTPADHASALLAAYDGAARLALPSSRDSAFDLPRGYAVADQLRTLRLARGERQRGYKIGFTNRTIWSRYGVFGPIWGPVWDTTLELLDRSDADLSLAGLVQPRLEPEVVFGFASAPRAGMTERELAGCIDWVAHGLEIVHTHFDGWKFQAADAVADFGLHGRLLVGRRVPMTRFASPREELAALTVELRRGAGLIDRGSGATVLDSPLTALRLWVDEMLAQPFGWPIEPGFVVTTGTLTDAAPVAPGEAWTTSLSDARLDGLTLRTHP